jgi:hypothetical protein
MTWAKACAMSFLVLCVSGCGHAEDLTRFAAENGCPLIVASSAEISGRTLVLYGARKINPDNPPKSIDVREFGGTTLVYVRNDDEFARLRYVGLGGVPSFNYAGDLPDWIYKMIPSILVDLKPGELVLAKVSLDGLVTTSQPTGIKMLSFPPEPKAK